MVETWEAWSAQIERDPRRDWCDELLTRLPPGARVVELGCGGGRDETRALARRFRLTGVDLSREQLHRARGRVPGADFVLGDFTEVAFPEESIDAVASFYAFNHVPRELLAPLLARVHGWLVRGGLLLVAFGVSDTEGWRGEWLGTTMYFSSFPPETNTRLVREAGFELLRDEVVDFDEPEGPASFQWVLARST
jgi:cyclopropane fatty-acyl-phospholipid synthase-like methyltransferase